MIRPKKWHFKCFWSIPLFCPLSVILNSIVCLHLPVGHHHESRHNNNNPLWREPYVSCNYVGKNMCVCWDKDSEQLMWIKPVASSLYRWSDLWSPSSGAQDWVLSPSAHCLKVTLEYLWSLMHPASRTSWAHMLASYKHPHINSYTCAI